MVREINQTYRPMVARFLNLWFGKSIKRTAGWWLAS
jgi:hypothetical protein